MTAKRLAIVAPLLLLALAPVLALNRPGDDGRPYHETQIPGHYRRWQASADGKISVIISAERTTFAAGDEVMLRCAVRNNTDKPMTILSPFGDDYFAEATGLNILGPAGVVGYVGAHKDYVLGDGSFLELQPKSVVEHKMTIPRDRFPDWGKPGLYVIDYRYLSAGYPKQPAPANFWTGYVDSNQVVVMIK
jgi:hypothetical protein